MEFKPKEEFQAELTENIRLKIERAAANPILDSRLLELNTELINLAGKPGDVIWKKEEEIEKEIFESSVVVQNIMEFKEVLNQIGRKCGMLEEEIIDLLAHENAHANVAEQTGHEWAGYIATFVKNKEGKIISINPAFFLKAQKHWNRIETISKRIMVTEAPLHYSNSLSPGDEESLEQDRRILKRLK